MSSPPITRNGPCLVELKAGRRYFWCTCGRSSKQPFCDGSHADTLFKPLQFTAGEDREVVLCGCKQTRTPPFCDGTHNNLSTTYKEASADEISSTASVPVTPRDRGDFGKASLSGGCFVMTPAAEMLSRHGAMCLTAVIHGKDGAKFFSQFYAEVDSGSTDVLQFPGSQTALFIRTGDGTVTICGREFPIGPETAVHILPGEAFCVRASGAEKLRMLITACPPVQEPAWLGQMPTHFNEAVPHRVRGIDVSLREPMADRFFQVLIGDQQEPSQVTGFLGEMPISRAANHRHLYEEAIMILDGEGFMWAEHSRAAIRAGDIIFLPRKVLHTVECTSAGGLRLTGTIYPAGSPAVNY